jgi:aspartate/tyrosine/aromatic aminotransferase
MSFDEKFDSLNLIKLYIAVGKFRAEKIIILENQAFQPTGVDPLGENGVWVASASKVPLRAVPIKSSKI